MQEQETVPVRDAHKITVDKALLTEGENTFTCMHCNQQLTLLWDGTSFSLTAEDEANPDFGTVDIEWKDNALSI